jgi:hypothetical protein
MSILKQLEETKITPEEIQELLLLLEDVLPKIEHKAKADKALRVLGDNLRAKVKDIQVTDIDSKENLDAGLEKLKSVKVKLEKASKVIGDL